MNLISTIIITKNEAANIRRCLESVKWTDEIIVLDSGSADNTIAICKEYTDNVFVTDWPGFGPQKNRALEKATKNWVLSIDADEWLSDELITEIQQTLNNPQAEGYYLPRHNQILGRFILHGEPGNDKVLRLFKREKGKFSNDEVHEQVLVNSYCATLNKPLLHKTSNTLDEMLDRLNRYTTITAEKRFQRGKKASLLKAITSSAWAFLQSYIVKRGFLDGSEGFLVAIGNAHGSFYRYAKLYLLNKNKHTHEK